MKNPITQKQMDYLSELIESNRKKLIFLGENPMRNVVPFLKDETLKDLNRERKRVQKKLDFYRNLLDKIIPLLVGEVRKVSN